MQTVKGSPFQAESQNVRAPDPGPSGEQRGILEQREPKQSTEDGVQDIRGGQVTEQLAGQRGDLEFILKSWEDVQG